MNEIKEIDVSKDLHYSIQSNADNLLISFYDGTKLRISWDLAQAIENYKK